MVQRASEATFDWYFTSWSGSSASDKAIFFKTSFIGYYDYSVPSPSMRMMSS